jgi:hypothetical protein
MEVTRNAPKLITVTEVVEVEKEVLSPETFTITFKEEGTLQFLQHLIGDTSHCSRVDRFRVSDDVSKELADLYRAIYGLGLERKSFSAKIIEC